MTRTSVPGTQRDDQLDSFGRYWINGVSCPIRPDSCGRLKLNWHTGQRVYGGPARDLNGAMVKPAPKQPRAFPRLRGDPSGEPADNPTEPKANDLVLETENRRRVLSQCHKRCSEITLAKGLVTWSEGRTVYAYRIASYRLSRTVFESPSPDLSVTHTRYRVVVCTSSGITPLITGRCFEYRPPV